MRRTILFIVLLALLTGCKSRRPFNVLAHDDMVDVLFDIHLAEATMNNLEPYASRRERQEYFNSVFEKYDITKEEFDKSLDWYARNPKKMILVYDDLKIRVDKLDKDIDEYIYHPELKPTHNDSIDTFDLWYWNKYRRLVATDSCNIPLDSAWFKIIDKQYLEYTEQINFNLKMSAESNGVRSNMVTRMIFYHDSVQDTLQAVASADSLYRRYHFYKMIPEGMTLDSILIQLVDKTDGISKISIDSVELLKIYNKFTHPMSYLIRNSIRNENDSIIKSNIKETEEDKERKNDNDVNKINANLKWMKMNLNK